MDKKILNIVWLSLAGVLFAGYLTFKKLFSGVCALNEGCSYFLGNPTCVYGLGIYFALLIFSTLSFFEIIKSIKPIVALSGVGILFAGYFSIYEIFFSPLNIFNGAKYALFLPSCSYGLVMYIVIFVLSLRKSGISSDGKIYKG